MLRNPKPETPVTLLAFSHILVLEVLDSVPDGVWLLGLLHLHGVYLGFGVWGSGVGLGLGLGAWG